MNTYRIINNGEERGPYTFEQLRSMWTSGQLTADTLYWQDGMPEWLSIEGLGLDLATHPISSPQLSTVLQRIPTYKHHVQHSGQVTTKSRGAVIVAIGSIMCIVGVIMAFTPAGIYGGLFLLVGFFVAVVGRMMS